MLDGKCTRLAQGKFDAATVYHASPLAVAEQLESAGFRHLHLVDLDGARGGSIVNWAETEAITRQTGLQVDFGGGIRTVADVQRLLDLGVRQVSIGSLAVRSPDTFRDMLRRFGPSVVMLSADVFGGEVWIDGWASECGLRWADLLSSFISDGLTWVVCTDIRQDGMLRGPSLDLYARMRREFPQLQLIASGGVSKLEDLQDLQALGVAGAIVGKALYENRIDWKALAALDTTAEVAC